jgi:hypothetical protein
MMTAESVASAGTHRRGACRAGKLGSTVVTSTWRIMSISPVSRR